MLLEWEPGLGDSVRSPATICSSPAFADDYSLGEPPLERRDLHEERDSVEFNGRKGELWADRSRASVPTAARTRR